MNAVGEIIRKRREEVGISKSMLARRMGCSPQNIDSLEKRKSIDFELAQRVSMILDFDVFESYRVKKDESDTEKELREELARISSKYIALLEKHNILLESRSIGSPKSV